MTTEAINEKYLEIPIFENVEERAKSEYALLDTKKTWLAWLSFGLLILSAVFFVSVLLLQSNSSLVLVMPLAVIGAFCVHKSIQVERQRNEWEVIDNDSLSQYLERNKDSKTRMAALQNIYVRQSGTLLSMQVWRVESIAKAIETEEQIKKLLAPAT